MGKLFAATAIVLLCSLPGAARAQGYLGYEDSIDFAGARLTLGMSQAQAAAALGGRYRLVAQPGNEAWLVEGSSAGPAAEPVGSLIFTGDRLTAMRRYWRQDNRQQSVEFASRLYAALAALTRYSGEGCAVRLSKGGAASDEKAIEIACDGKAVQIRTQPTLAKIDEIAETVR